MSTTDESADRSSMDVDSEMDHGDLNEFANSSQANGDSLTPPSNSSPSPPPKPSIDPEACKALGNKYFKAKDYTRAVAEYTKGRNWSS